MGMVVRPVVVKNLNTDTRENCALKGIIGLKL